MSPTKILLGCCLLDGACIDKAVAAGVTPQHFTDTGREVWPRLVALRADGKSADIQGLALTMQPCPYDYIMDAERSAPTTLHFDTALNGVLWDHSKAKLIPAVTDLSVAIAGGVDRKEIAQKIENIGNLASVTSQTKERPIEAVVAEVQQWAADQDSGKPQEAAIGLDFMENLFTPVSKQEIIVVGGRPAQGKSSLSLQLVGVNLGLRKKVAHFALETSATACVKQLAAQRARVNLRNYPRELPDAKEKFVAGLNYLMGEKALRVFDQCMSMESIEAQCRLLRASWKPDLVSIDYLQLIQLPGKNGLAETITNICTRLIALQKIMDCPFLVCAQLNRENDKESRAPRLSDFKESGAIEQMAHRAILLYRPVEDFTGMTQVGPEVGERSHYDYYLLQAKLRDGPTPSIKAKFDARHTLFVKS